MNEFAGCGAVFFLFFLNIVGSELVVTVSCEAKSVELLL